MMELARRRSTKPAMRHTRLDSGATESNGLGDTCQGTAGSVEDPEEDRGRPEAERRWNRDNFGSVTQN